MQTNIHDTHNMHDILDMEKINQENMQYNMHSNMQKYMQNNMPLAK
jgi:hypothetical protein